MSRRKVYDTQIAIYKITNIVNNKIYIGSTESLTARRANHFSSLRYNRHGNSYLQNAWNKYGGENFIFEIIEYFKNNLELFKRENYWIDFYNSTNRMKGYNLGKVNERKGGPMFSQEIINFLTEKAKREMTPEKILKITAGTKRKIKMFDLDDNFIREYDSITAASENGKYKRNIISNICRNIPRYKTHKGYKWRYSIEK